MGFRALARLKLAGLRHQKRQDQNEASREPPTLNAIKVATHRLRKKLVDLEASASIQTLRGIGYFMDDGEQ